MVMRLLSIVSSFVERTPISWTTPFALPICTISPTSKLFSNTIERPARTSAAMSLAPRESASDTMPIDPMTVPIGKPKYCNMK